MAESPNAVKAPRRQGNWRHRENRASSKYVAKRVTEDDHKALTKYAEDQGVKVADLLTPLINELLARAHEHCEQSHGELTVSAKAS